MLSSCLSLKESWKMRVEGCACCVWLLWRSKESQHVPTARSKASPVCFSWNFILNSAVIQGNIRNYLWKNHKIICKTWATFAASFTAVSVSITEALMKFLLPSVLLHVLSPKFCLGSGSLKESEPRKGQSWKMKTSFLLLAVGQHYRNYFSRCLHLQEFHYCLQLCWNTGSLQRMTTDKMSFLPV